MKMLKSQDHAGWSMKSLFSFVSFSACTMVFIKVAWTATIFDPMIFVYYSGSSLLSYSPKLLVTLAKIYKGVYKEHEEAK